MSKQTQNLSYPEQFLVRRGSLESWGKYIEDYKQKHKVDEYIVPSGQLIAVKELKEDKNYRLKLGNGVDDFYTLSYLDTDLEEKLNQEIQDRITSDEELLANDLVILNEAKQYADDLISGALKRVIVDELPTEDIDLNTIYMVLRPESEPNNIYDEYMYIDDEWEKLGSTEINLDDYYTKDETNNLLDDRFENMGDVEFNHSEIIKTTISHDCNEWYTEIEETSPITYTHKFTKGVRASDVIDNKIIIEYDSKYENISSYLGYGYGTDENTITNETGPGNQVNYYDNYCEIDITGYSSEEYPYIFIPLNFTAYHYQDSSYTVENYFENPVIKYNTYIEGQVKKTINNEIDNDKVVKKAIYDLLVNAVYTTNNNKQYFDIIKNWLGSYTISYDLYNCTLTNTNDLVLDETAYISQIILNNEDDRFILDVSVVMDGVDITKRVYNSSTKSINISKVTGNVQIKVNYSFDWSNDSITLIADDFINGGLNPTYPPAYVNPGYGPNIRTSYGTGNIIIEQGYKYTITYDANTVQSLGVHQVNEIGYNAIKTNKSFTDVNKNDSGWQNNGYSFTPLESINGSPAKCMWITFNNNKQSMNLRTVTITREEISL